ncbi:MAG: Hsp20/alpha crystallin family protein [Acidiferrobacterales bacterium]|nr:Hsp20/alpha crystallin family protein [Acidiferrobacterales bacterium]
MNQLVRTRDWSTNPVSVFDAGWGLYSPFSKIRNAVPSGAAVLAVDISETDTGYDVVADLPGISKDALNVSVADNVLSIEVSAEKDNEDNLEGRMIRRERYRGKVTRSFKLGEAMDSENIQASYKDGVLSVSVPKKEISQPKKIEVSVH